MISKEEAKNIINALLERFDYHLEEYKKGSYNETQTRNDYINPFFEALGWDINNKQGLAESYREVIHEDKIKIGGQTKAPDYCFTIYGQRKFFVEAKKPSVSIKDSIDPAYQLRRYGWSAKMPISIITDFEEFSIYDCTIKPAPMDRASVARIKYITFKDYLNEFDFIWDTFSKEMILKGSFDKFVSSDKGKKGTADVDAEFLKSLDSWRDLLARNIVNRNKDIDEETLNFSLQKIMDRLIFLRISEDRGIELENTLLDTIGTSIYDKLKNIFISSEQKYNSSLFDFKKDQITRNLNIDDRVLKTIIEEMYYPKCPYEFSVIPVEILGHSYEQYLGKVIRITPGHILKIETKPEVRKAGGVYYTPQYIVDYIVKNTVGKLLGDWELGIRNRELGNELNQNIGLDYETESKDLQGVAGLGRGDEISRDDLHNNENSSETGNVWANQPNTESSSFNTSEYSGGLGKKLEKGAEKVLPNCERVGVRTRNASDFNSETGFDKQSGYASNLEKTSNSKQTFERNDSLNKQEQSQFLIPNSRPLTPDEVSKIKICDPACGSGSFLLGAYQYLLDWHKDYYTKQGKKSKGGKDSPLTPLGELTTNEKKRILLNNIYGVDLDSNAVEVSKLSLLLKCMEGETKETVETQIKLFHERVLPSLDNNIKSGNSLIDMDFYDSQIDFEPDVEKKIKPFNWESAFPEVFGSRESGVRKREAGIGKREAGFDVVIGNQESGIGNREGGFDVVIGNPPWGADFSDYSEYIQKKYANVNIVNDSTAYFMEKSFQIGKSFIGMIVMNSVVFVKRWQQARELLMNNGLIVLANVGLAFNDANIESTVFIANKNNKQKKYLAGFFQPEKKLLPLKQFISLKYYDYDVVKRFNAFIASELNAAEQLIIEKMYQIDTTFQYYIENINRGIDLESELINDDLHCVKYIRQGPQINRYKIVSLKFINEKVIPNTKKVKNLRKIKIIGKPLRGKRLAFTVDSSGEIITGSNYANIYLKDEFQALDMHYFILGVLNSRIISTFMVSALYSNNTETARHIDKDYLFRVPIPIVKKDDEYYKVIVHNVNSMLQLNKDLQNAKLPEHKEQLQARISYTDKKIDSLVYQLYDLTEEEIKIVEGE